MRWAGDDAEQAEASTKQARSTSAVPRASVNLILSSGRSFALSRPVTPEHRPQAKHHDEANGSWVSQTSRLRHLTLTTKRVARFVDHRAAHLLDNFGARRADATDARLKMVMRSGKVAE
jgi:hypothetical protein